MLNRARPLQQVVAVHALTADFSRDVSATSIDAEFHRRATLVNEVVLSARCIKAYDSTWYMVHRLQMLYKRESWTISMNVKRHTTGYNT